jgi:hypothetical protein
MTVERPDGEVRRADDTADERRDAAVAARERDAAAEREATDEQATDERTTDERAADERAADERAADERAADERASATGTPEPVEGRAADERASSPLTPGPAEAQAATMPGADEQLTVPEDREAAARADSRAEGRPDPTGERPYEVLADDETLRFRERWDEIQAGFVDDPAAAARLADALVGEVLGRLGERHRALREELGRRPDGGGDTEAMRLVLRRYRVFLMRLVAAE